MRNSLIIRFVLVVGLVAIAVLINIYYWSDNSLSLIKDVPLKIMLLAFGYILIQIIKRFVSKSQNWWDWLYYIGLISMMTPTLIADESNSDLLNRLCDFGVFFLLLPAIKDLYNLLRGKL